MSNEAYQHDHTVNPHQKIVVNSYDWLQFRDEQDHCKSKNPITHASPGVGSNAQNSDIAEAPQVFHPSYQSLVNVPSESPRPDQTSGSNPAVGLLHNAEDKASGQEEEGSQYEIQYSVFRPLHAYPTKGLAYEQLRRKEEQEQRENFNHLVSDCIEAVETFDANSRESKLAQVGRTLCMEHGPTKAFRWGSSSPRMRNHMAHFLPNGPNGHTARFSHVCLAEVV